MMFNHKIEGDSMKIKSKSRFVAGVLLIVCSLWAFGDSPHVLTYGELLAPIILGVYFALDGIFGIISHMRNAQLREIGISTKPLKSSRLSMEEKYYYKGKTNQQLHQYSEALECYKKALELNPDFGPAKEAKKEVEEIIN